MPCLTHREVRYPHREPEAVFIDTQSEEKAALQFHILSARLALGFPVMPICMPVFWAPSMRSCLPPPVGEAEGREPMSDFLLKWHLPYISDI